MPTYFPQINGVTTQLPYLTDLTFETVRNDIDTGQRYAFARRSEPLGKFAVQFRAIEDADRQALAAFVASMQGPVGEFSFLDPAGNLVPFSEDFSDASWAKTTVTVGANVADPFGGALATSLESAGSNGALEAEFLPGGDGGGYWFCASVWAKAIGAQSLSIGIADDSPSLLGSTVHSLPDGIWTRISHGMQVASNNPLAIRIGGNWDTSTIHLFGAQVNAMPGPGAYAKTPGREGLRAKCRFEQEAFPQRFDDYNQTRIELPIVEYA